MPKHSCCTSETQGWRFLRVRECTAPKNIRAAHSLNPASSEAPLRAYARNKNRKCAALDVQRSAPSYIPSCIRKLAVSDEVQYAVAYVLRSLLGFRRPSVCRPDARLREVSAFRPGRRVFRTTRPIQRATTVSPCHLTMSDSWGCGYFTFFRFSPSTVCGFQNEVYP